MTTNYGGLTAPNISFFKRRGLSEEEFQEFLRLAREIANYNPEDKSWSISPEKLERKDKGEVARILARLKRLSTLGDREVSLVLSMLDDFKQKARIGSDLRLLGIPGSLLDKLAVDSELGGFVVFDGGDPRLKSVMFVKKVAGLLREKYGLEVDFDRGLLKVEVRRENGELVWKLSYLDKLLFSKVSELGTLKYYIEKAVLSGEGEFEGTELVERRIRVVRVDWHKKEFFTPVALLNKFEKFFLDIGFSVTRVFEERSPISINMQRNFSLLPHQEEVYRLWSRKRRGTVAIFTRGGKSFIALQAIHDLHLPTIVFVTTKELLETWITYFEKYLGIPRSFIGVLGAGEQKIRDITVATYTSATKYIDSIRSRFELAIFDEAHHVPASTFKQVALQIDALYRLALSATPERRDRNEALLFELCGELLYKLTYEDLVSLKVVAPIEVMDAFFVEGPKEKIKKLLDLLERHKNGKIIIFTQYLQTANELFEVLRQKGYKAELITGETPEAKRENSFRNFVDGRSNIIVTTTVLDEGITVPDADVAVIYEGTGEGRQMIQRIGRVLGYLPGKTAKIYEIIDVTNPREKSAYRRRSWVLELYRTRNLEEIVRAVKEGREDKIKPSYQYHLDSF
ncbi:DEAD/DEAH box helicase [Thermofilum sp.]|jgi:superfamily II DNA or RNA helicase|uniref:DEAD/DEAH box helicase n=1 Tax=Thermofilum sp. TaxID=1961369 RepID=UPI0025832F80|nr:DEAD/DEAH box helicase [Thermofilum sp.]